MHTSKCVNCAKMVWQHKFVYMFLSTNYKVFMASCFSLEHGSVIVLSVEIKAIMQGLSERMTKKRGQFCRWQLENSVIILVTISCCTSHNLEIYLCNVAEWSRLVDIEIMRLLKALVKEPRSKYNLITICNDGWLFSDMSIFCGQYGLTWADMVMSDTICGRYQCHSFFSRWMIS